MSNVSLIDGHIDDDVIETEALTDEQIIKAIERCIGKDFTALWYVKTLDQRIPISIRDILRVISNQKEEIERLGKAESFERNVTKLFDKYKDHIKAEAVKEFADLAIKKICENVTPIPQQRYLVKMCVEEIENTKKEMVGEMDV